jgi:hypothetical protein
MKTLSPILIPMHFGVCRGISYINGESVLTLTVAVQANSGQRQIQLNDSTGLYVNQLIAYTSTASSRNDYYSARISAINGNIITVDENIEVTIQTGNNVFCWWDNFSHPTNQGMYSIIDYAFRYIAGGNRTLDKNRILNIYGSSFLGAATVINTATVELNTINGYVNPGSPNYPSLKVICNNQSDGITLVSECVAGSYSFDVCIGGGNTANVITVVFKQGITTLKTETYSSDNECIKIINGNFTVGNGSVTIEIKQTGVLSYFNVGYVRIIKQATLSTVLNYGNHVILGDSWAAYNAFRGSLIYHLPNASNITNKGFGGSTAESTLERFDSDVFGLNLDFIWIMVGTNDYYGANFIGSRSFNSSIELLINKCISIGAKPIIFDCSVGARTYAGYADWQLTNRSHVLTVFTNYNYDKGDFMDIGNLDTNNLSFVVSSSMLGRGSLRDEQRTGNLPMWSSDGTIRAAMTSFTPGYGHVYDASQELWVTKSDLISSYLNLSTNFFTNINKFTAFFWLVSPNVDAPGSSILQRYYDSNNRVFLQMNGAGNTVASVAKSGPGYGAYDTSTKVSNNVPFCLAWVYDKDGAANSDREKIYINGVLTTLSFTDSISSTGTFGFSTQVLMLLRACGLSATTILLYENVVKTITEVAEISNQGPLFNCIMIDDGSGYADIRSQKRQKMGKFAISINV